MYEVEWTNTKTGENAIEFNHSFTANMAIKKCKHYGMDNWEVVCVTYVD